MLQKYWSVPLNGVSVGAQNVKLGSTSAVFDSGTHLIITSSADAKAINEARAPGSPCSWPLSSTPVLDTPQRRSTSLSRERAPSALLPALPAMHAPAAPCSQAVWLADASESLLRQKVPCMLPCRPSRG